MLETATDWLLPVKDGVLPLEDVREGVLEGDLDEGGVVREEVEVRVSEE